MSNNDTTKDNKNMPALAPSISGVRRESCASALPLAHDSWVQEISAWADDYNIPEETLPRTQAGLQALETLNLQDNQLTKLPDTIGNLTKLTTLRLGWNQLSKLPDTIGNLTSLKWLHLDANKLSELPDSVGNLTKLTTLNLWGNQFVEVPDIVGKLTSLIILDLRGNVIFGLPPHLMHLRNVAHFFPFSPYKTTKE